jgi:molecular chaperone IbpA
MTTQRIAFGPHFNNYLGIDSLIRDMERIASLPQQEKYPPYNTIELEDNKFLVELAIAGFSIDDLSVVLEDGKLIISGDKSQKSDDTVKYLHRGISTKSFSKTIPVVDTVVVNRAEHIDGILRIYLENIIPEHRKPKRITINNYVEPVLLAE